MNPQALMVLALSALILSLLGVEVVRRYSLKRALLDIPGERSSHHTPTPRGGGVAIVLIASVGLLVHWLWLGQPSGRIVATYWIGAALLAGIGWLDDLRSVRPRWRFAVHGLAAAAAIVGFGFWSVLELPLLGAVSLGWLGLALTWFWIVGLINAYNFMDGIDGIAGLQGLVAGLGWFGLGLYSGGPAATVLGLLLAAGSLGFLVHNWQPARIFMGDAASTFMGFSFAVLALLEAERVPRLALAGALLVWPFVFDASLTFLRRWRRGEQLARAHRSHLYQRLVISGLSHRRVSLLYGLLALAGLALATVWVRRPATGAPLVAAVLPLLGFGLWGYVVRRETGRRPALDPAQRKLHEREYFDHAYQEGVRQPAAKFYSIVASSKGWYRERVLELGRGKRVLEYGCGTGSSAFELGRLGATVCGIDISATAVEMASRRAREQKLDNVSFAVMDAERTDFPSASFDLICGSGILHHLEVSAAMREITRLLRPDGHALFFEALGHNPLINWYRRWTPKLRSPDERPLKLSDLEVITRHFERPELRFFHLFALAAIPLRNRKAFQPLLQRLDALDRWCFATLPWLRRHAWIAVLDLQQPIPDPPRAPE